MAELNLSRLKVRSYEISIWTLQDRFVSILKWSTMDLKGLVQNPEIILRDDGTLEFTFTIPLYYLEQLDRISNPLWIHLNQLPLEANMHKLKVVFNKGTEDEAVLEFLVVSVTEDHNRDEVNITVKAEGLAFHELGKTGYRISLSQENFEKVEEDWFKYGYNFETHELAPRPLMNLQFWNDLIFKDSEGDWRTNWRYEVLMDWSAFSNNGITNRKTNVLYEDAYVSSWETLGDSVKPRAVEDLREKERPIEISESNYYNVTQTIAELFGVFCRYEYEHNDRYEIIGRKVVYYNNYIKDEEGHIDLTYPYSSSAIIRTTDNTELTTKLYIPTVEDDDYGPLSIIYVDANKSKEDYLLNFDYLIKIGAITEELNDELKKFLLKIRNINEILLENKERTDIIKDLLVDVSANVTFYDNALKMDIEQYRLNENLYNSITDGGTFVPLEKSFTVMDGRDRGYGWYINITTEGLDGSSIALYESRKMSSGASGVGYENPISGFQCIMDEYGNIIRILNIVRTDNLIDDSLIYLIGLYDPKSKYENILKVWNQRRAIDEKKYEDAVNEEVVLNWYLYGSRVEYARVDGTKLDGEYHGIGILWEEEMGPPPNDPKISHYNLFLAYELDTRILGTEQDIIDLWDDTLKSTGTYTGIIGEKPSETPDDSLIKYYPEDLYSVLRDYLSTNIFAEDDLENSTPDLLYFYDIYTSQKEKLVNAFERMMGPALREGYWQPENYNDYGDVYYDSFVIGSLSERPKTPYLHFLWDHEKYYENEEPAVYMANAAGDMRLHLIINLSNHLEELKNHLDGLFIGYRDPASYVTIKELEGTINELRNKEVNKTYSDDKIFEATYLNLDSLKSYYGNHALSSIYSNTSGSILASHNNEALNADSEIINALIHNINTVLAPSSDTLSNTSEEIVSALSNVSSSLNSLKVLVDNWISVENEILKKISNPANYSPHSSNDSSNPGHLLLLLAEQTKITNLLTLVGKTLSWYGYELSVENLIATLNLNKDSYYRTFGLDADCELGWVIDRNEENPQPIPVLIVTGADKLSDIALKYILTGEFTYNTGATTDTNEPIKETIIADLDGRAFIGYYNGKLDERVEELTKFRLFNLEMLNSTTNGDFIGDATITKITKAVDGDVVPIEVKDYRYLRVYPRLYFSTGKLRNASSKLRLKLNYQELNVNEDYTIITDDRSKGLRINGIGFYLTLREKLLYYYLCLNMSMKLDILYTLLNADTSIYLDAIKVSKENAQPKVSYDVQVSVLNPEFVRTAYNRLNLIVHINDNDLKLEDVSGYISSVTLKLDRPWEDTIEIKNYQTKFEDLFSTIVAQAEAMKKGEGGLSNAVRAFNAYGFIDSDVLQDSMLMADLNLYFNKGTLSISLKDGIWGESDAGVVAFRGGGIFTATTKDANGNWNWNTGILPSGINASLITTGLLDTNKIKIYAGNELRFLMNGDGLYAYKGFSLEDFNKLTINATETEKEAINELIKNASKKLYLIYNSEGLFLRAEPGAYILKNLLMYDRYNNPIYETKTIERNGQTYTYDIVDPISGEKILKTLPVYNEIGILVDRVEVSWEGLILRNWEGERVFYADPDTGNLTLKGYVEASGGEIGGWILGKDRLTSNGISLISGPANAAGIQLAPTGLRQNTVTDPLNRDEIFYVYEEVLSDGVGRTFYLKEDSLFDLTISELLNSLLKLYVRQDKIIPEPKYLVVKESISEGNPLLSVGETDGRTSPDDYVITLSLTNSALIENTTYYIKESENAEDYIKDLNGEYIEYVYGDDNNDWFTSVQEKYLEEVYLNFINITKIDEYVRYNLAPNETITLRPVGSDEITFQVSAATGQVTILSGTLGNVTIVKDLGLEGGTLSKTELKPDNIFKIGETLHNFGELFYDFNIDSNSGEVTLYKVNGTQKNFNIAATLFYKNAIAAASRLTLTINVNGTNVAVLAESGTGDEKKTKSWSQDLGSNGGSVTATAKNGMTSITKNVNVSGYGMTGSDNEISGLCPDCTKSCFHSCGKVCDRNVGGGTTGKLITENCQVNCIGKCRTDCTAGCQGCSSTCSGACGASCENGCTSGCKGTCTGCTGGCSSHCTGTCKRKLSDICSGCGGDCTGGNWPLIN